MNYRVVVVVGGRGGKALLPAGVLEELASRPIMPSPLLFRLDSSEAYTHVGVLEFVAEPGTIALPQWVLDVQPGQVIGLSLAGPLPVAQFARFRPLDPEFLDISDPKAVLENTLREFACLTTGDTFHIIYNNKTYRVMVEELKPDEAVNVIECDMEVEFSVPEEWLAVPQKRSEKVPPVQDPQGFAPFCGVGLRPDGKPVPETPIERPRSSPGAPDYGFTPGHITFQREPPP